MRKIIINFCFSLLFLLVTFVFGVDVVHPQWACHLVATLIHLFTLSTFLWMGVQAVFLYKKAVRATKNRGQSKKTYKVSFVISWGRYKKHVVKEYAVYQPITPTKKGPENWDVLFNHTAHIFSGNKFFILQSPCF